MNWRIYYVDDTTFSDEDGTWEEAPADGIVCVVVRDKDYGRYVLNGLNYYYMPDGDPKPTDVTHTNDINPQLRVRCPWLKYGVGTTRDKWISTLIRATKDPDFGEPRAPQRRSTDREG